MALCTESHVGYIFLEPAIDCWVVERVNGNGQVVAHHILLLVRTCCMAVALARPTAGGTRTSRLPFMCRIGVSLFTGLGRLSGGSNFKGQLNSE